MRHAGLGRNRVGTLVLLRHLVLLLLCAAAVRSAPPWPESLASAKRELPTEAEAFVQESLANYQAELAAMRELYLALGGALPSDAEAFFTNVTVPDPPEFTIQVEADALDDSLPAAKTDNRPAGIIYGKVRGTLSGSTSGGAAAHGQVVQAAASFLRASGFAAEPRIDAVLAADGVTADLLGLPRLVYVHASAQTLTVLKDGSGYTYGNDQTQAVYQVTWDDGLAGESNGALSRVHGEKPGVYEIRAIGYNVFKDTTKDAHGRIAKVNVHPSKRFDIARVLVVQAESLALDGIDPATLVAIRRTVSSPAQPHYRSFGVATSVSAGRDSRNVAVSPTKITVAVQASRGLRFERKADRVYLQFDDSLPGVCRFCLRSAAVDGAELVSPAYVAGVNTMRIVLEPDPGESGLAQGQTYTVRAVAEGGAPMSGWRATWEGPKIAEKNAYWQWTMGDKTLAGDVVGDWGATEDFAPAGDAWEVSTPLRIDRLATNAWDQERLSRAFAGQDHAGDGQRVAFRLRLRATGDTTDHTFDFPSATDGRGATALNACMVRSPAMTGLGLLARASRAGAWRQAPARLDLFVSSRSSSVPAVSFQAGATFANGMEVDPIAPANRAAFSLLLDPPDALHATALGTYCATGKTEASTVTVRAQSTAERAHGNGLSLAPSADELLSEACTVAVNRLALDSKREGDALVYRLFAFGNADMTTYRARWRLRILNPRAEDISMVEAFRTGGDGSALSTCEMGFTKGIANGYVLGVDVLDAEGAVVAELTGGAALNDAVEVVLRVPESAPPDSRVAVQALIRNLDPELAARTTCRWSTSLPVGEFERNSTALTSLGNGTYRSTTFLRLKATDEHNGKKPGVHVNLVLGD